MTCQCPLALLRLLCRAALCLPPAVRHRTVPSARSCTHLRYRMYRLPAPAEQAMSVLKDYYLQLRIQSAADPGSLPVTARQLESLVRLCEARARLELREEVTAGDAEVRGRWWGVGIKGDKGWGGDETVGRWGQKGWGGEEEGKVPRGSGWQRGQRDAGSQRQCSVWESDCRESGHAQQLLHDCRVRPCCQ